MATNKTPPEGFPTVEMEKQRQQYAREVRLRQEGINPRIREPQQEPFEQYKGPIGVQPSVSNENISRMNENMKNYYTYRPPPLPNSPEALAEVEVMRPHIFSSRSPFKIIINKAEELKTTTTCEELEEKVKEVLATFEQVVRSDILNPTKPRSTLNILQAFHTQFFAILYELDSAKRISFNRGESYKIYPTATDGELVPNLETYVGKFRNILKSINCVGPDTTRPIIPTQVKKKLVSFDTSLGTTLSEDFSDVEQIRDWFATDNNYVMYLYGVGRIMRAKEQVLQEQVKLLQKQIETVNDDYDTGIHTIDRIVPGLPPLDPAAAYKEKLKEKLVEDNNDGYRTQVFELIQRSNRYEEVIQKLHNRRAYLVYYMNTPNMGRKVIVDDNIIKMAKVFYEQYKGIRYKELRSLIFNLVKIIAYNPNIIEKSFVLNASITGPAGSGKTTLAVLLAKWYNLLGLLTSDSFLENENERFREAGRAELIGQYMGQTAPRTLGVLYGSLEKALFIDEAYSVSGCSFDKKSGKLDPDSYGEEFIGTILPFMAKHQGVGCVLVAGYKNLMDLCFFQRNEGLPRRFPVLIDLPLYTTDELYNIFLNFNIVKRPVAAIIGKTPEETRALKDEYRQAKRELYIDLKPAFFMFHFDTANSAPELLRKYLLFIKIRGKKFQESGVPRTEVEYSDTIVNHVLTCILSNPLRRNILRYYFYKKVFEFDTQNLSFFPAQAGEMGLVADKVNKKIEVYVNEQRVLQKKVTTITYEREVDLFNEYFLNKNLELRYFERETEEGVHAEIVRMGYRTSDFTPIISSILIDNIYPDYKTKKMTLQQVFENLFTSRDILMKVIQEYVKIAKEVLPTLLAIPENLFPVNMVKTQVETEKIIIDFYDKNPTNSALFEEENRGWNEAKFALVKDGKVTLEHPMHKSSVQKDKEYAEWEDFGIQKDD
jgi:hypothetical protein